MREVVFVIDEQGNQTVEVNGVNGPACEFLTREIESIGKVTSRKRKPEYARTGGTLSLGRKP